MQRIKYKRSEVAENQDGLCRWLSQGADEAFPAIIAEVQIAVQRKAMQLTSSQIGGIATSQKKQDPSVWERAEN